MLRLSETLDNDGMRVNLMDVHDSHGLVFTLDFVGDGGERDSQILVELNDLLRYVTGEGGKSCVLYAYGVKTHSRGLTLKLTEGTKRIAKVNGLWNFRREDQKFAVVVLEGDQENGDGDAPAKRYLCHLCDKETWGVNRQRMEVYDRKTRSIKEVNVHSSCKLEHFKQNKKS